MIELEHVHKLVEALMSQDARLFKLEENLFTIEIAFALACMLGKKVEHGHLSIQQGTLSNARGRSG
jgi:hypothetical protein